MFLLTASVTRSIWTKLCEVWSEKFSQWIMRRFWLMTRCRRRHRSARIVALTLEIRFGFQGKFRISIELRTFWCTARHSTLIIQALKIQFIANDVNNSLLLPTLINSGDKKFNCLNLYLTNWFLFSAAARRSRRFSTRLKKSKLGEKKLQFMRFY